VKNSKVSGSKVSGHGSAPLQQGYTIMAKKGPRGTTKLVSSAGTGVVYFTSKNSRNTTEKLKLSKYDKVVKKHVEFTEGKMK
jgi:large subunit ribosomal protein L33